MEISLNKLHEELKDHIRFEERILFNEIQSAASQDQLDKIEQFHSSEKFEDNLSDIFWK